MTAVLFVLAAAAGSVARWAIGQLVCSWQAVLAVNVAGSALLGWLLSTDASSATVTVVGVGFAGSLTTFSSFALETIRSRPGFAVGYLGLMLAGCLGAASIAAML